MEAVKAEEHAEELVVLDEGVDWEAMARPDQWDCCKGALMPYWL